jgi:hypothetical protein
MVSLAIAYRRKGWNVRRRDCFAKALPVKRFADIPQSLSIVNLISRAYRCRNDHSELLWGFLCWPANTVLSAVDLLDSFIWRNGPEAFAEGWNVQPIPFRRTAWRSLTLNR